MIRDLIGGFLRFSQTVKIYLNCLMRHKIAVVNKKFAVEKQKF